MSSPSLSEVSETFSDRKARATENGVMTEVEGVTVYPFENDWWITIDCGEPFEQYFARTQLGESAEESLKTLDALYEDFSSIDDLEESFIEVDLSADHRTSSDAPDAALELEYPVLVNGFESHFTEVLRSQEYHLKKNRDLEYIKREVEKEVHLYNSIQRALDETKELVIKDVNPVNESSVNIEVAGFNCEKTLEVHVELPNYDEIKDSPVSRFIDIAGSGKIDNLSGSSVFLYRANHSEEVVGCDNKFGKFGLANRPIEKESGGFLSRIL